ncbi:hypothetical protein [Microseira sp. BLCC-F43]|jgi:hypothetical protein|uniref:hypothetical protein n=1 Tax=Microseira sp. BLCC-F43 TaxID=3153602 RepID=UPI0035B76836
MSEVFQGNWRWRVTEKNAGFDQRFRIEGASSGNGIYPGVVGTEVVVNGDNWTVTLEWNNGVGSGWQESAVLSSVGSLSPLVLIRILGADDNYPDQRDGDFDDLTIVAVDLDPIFDVVQRPFAVDRGTLTMLPDGIFDVSQGIQYMGVRIRNDWDYDWDETTGVTISISNTSRIQLQSQGIRVIDAWTTPEQKALQQEMSGGFVKIPVLRKGQERTIYFKLDVSSAKPSKPNVNFVAQRVAWDPAYDAPSRQVARQIFISRSTYDPLNRELVAEVPEGTVYMRLNKVIVDKESLEKATLAALKNPCKRQPPRPGQDSKTSDRDRLRDDLKRSLEDLLSGKPVDPCRLHALLDTCCSGSPECKDGGGTGETNPGSGGLGDGPGGDNWCRFKPFNWLPVEFEYRIVPSPPFAGQFGPLAFEDPWWKVILIILAALLAAASLVYDYIFAGQDPNFVIGNITAKSNRSSSNVDAAIARLNGSRAIDLNVLEAQSDDRNNNLPINGSTGGTVAIDRSDNGDRGIQNAILGNAVFKSGARSATTRGLVSSISLNTNVDGVSYTNQVLIAQLAAPNNQPLSQGGDSGSLWVDLIGRRPVALNFAGPVSDDGSNAIANPIRDVVNLFDLHFNV